ncbi:hypothetical protein SAMN06297387_101343 [Streptomyces zhaozhouensis]|uniref:Integral membrane protein n=1 Tax=Streptomyces zhaozhouensis TaxID=1300267 RepID=A0A286DK17_9ACTN|nr:hypothetical protein [Streptomyces zhaozhouensis]SOD58824.1 hypothetical protein SAMN06297387_101343 [Streptomyces zhaozhouensis]
MAEWWYRNIVEPGKQPLLLALLAFVLTFAVTRCVTRLIRAGRGPFHDVSAGGQHVHHVVPGVLLMLVGGFGGVATGGRGWAAGVLAVVFGVGAGLVLDEFALILYMQDVYWSERGRQSVEVVMVTTALGGMLLVGFLPLGVDGLTPDDRGDRGGLVATLLLHFVCALVCLVKGKPKLAVFGVLVPLIAIFGALRLARPDSPWAHRLYRNRPRLTARAERRARRHDRRWNGPRRRVQDWLGGTPTGEREGS